MNAYCFLQFFDGLVVSFSYTWQRVYAPKSMTSKSNIKFISVSSKCVCTGIFLGTGKQKIPAVANFIGYYCIGLSLSITLTFVAKLRVLGNCTKWCFFCNLLKWAFKVKLALHLSNLSFSLQVSGLDCLFVSFYNLPSTLLSSLSWTGNKSLRRYHVKTTNKDTVPQIEDQFILSFQDPKNINESIAYTDFSYLQAVKRAQKNPSLLGRAPVTGTVETSTQDQTSSNVSLCNS